MEVVVEEPFSGSTVTPGVSVEGLVATGLDSVMGVGAWVWSSTFFFVLQAKVTSKAAVATYISDFFMISSPLDIFTRYIFTRFSATLFQHTQINASTDQIHFNKNLQEDLES